MLAITAAKYIGAGHLPAVIADALLKVTPYNSYFLV